MFGLIRRSIRNQLTMRFGLFLSVGLLVILLSTYWKAEERLLEQVDAHAAHVAIGVAAASHVWLISHDYAGLQEIVDALKMDADMEFAMILNHEGKVVAHTDRHYLGQFIADLPAKSATKYYYHRSLQLLDIAVPVNNEGARIGWVRLALSSKHAQQLLRAHYQELLVFALLLLLTGGYFAYFVGQRLTRKLNTLRAVTDAVEAGHLSVRAPVEGNDEPAILSQRFNTMLDQLQLDLQERAENEAKLRISEERWHFALEGAGDGVWDWDLLNNRIEYSRRWYEIQGMPEGSMAPQAEAWQKLVHPEDLPHVEAALAAHLNGQTTNFSCEHRVRCGDGSYKWILGRGVVVSRDTQGTPRRIIGTHSDISHERLARELLAQSEQSHRYLFQNASVGIAKVSTSGEFLEINEKFCRIIGYTREEVLHNHITLQQITLPEDLDADMANVKRLLSGQAAQYDMNKRYRTQSGKIIWVHLSVQLARDAAGQPDYFVSAIQDITDWVETQERLAANQLLLNEIVNSSPYGVALFDRSHRRLVSNDNYQRILDLPADKVAAADWTFADQVHYCYQRGDYGQAESVGALLAHFKQLRQAGISSQGERLQANGTWIEYRAIPVSGDMHLLIYLDITQRKIDELEARRYQELVASSSDAIITKNLDGIVLSWNHAAEILFGYSQQEMIGQPMLKLLPENAINEELDILQRTGHGETLPAFEGLRVCKDGRIVDVSLSISPIHNAAGNIIAISTIARDITAKKQTEQTLIKARMQAEAANHAKSAFLATMSHEIRTPLNAIIGMAYLLAQTDLNPAQRADLQSIESSGKNLLALINDILDFSKIEAGELSLDNHVFSLLELLHDLQAIFTPMVANKHLLLHIPPLPDHIPINVIGDGNRLRQCLINLLSNAVKFTQQGEVTLGLERLENPTDSPSNALRLRFTVHDNGIGMSDEQLANLFQPFTQADTSTTRRYGGTGLGLSIVKHLVELMQGQIGVHSQPDQGATFWIEIPLQTAPENTHIVARSSESRLLSILIAEDEGLDRKILVQMCRNFGWEVEAVENGEELVQRVLYRLQQHRPLDCILLDWRMPTLDGVAALAKLKQRIGSAHMPSVIMVTANDRYALLQALQHEQPDSILTKPVMSSTLFNAINEAVVTHHHDFNIVLRATRISGEHGLWLPGTQILVVDDSQLNLNVIGRILQNEGATPILCDSGESAIAKLSESELDVDVILMDLQMPGLDGYQTTQRLRQELGIRLPIIALTAGSTTTERTKALHAGMNDYLTKPVDPSRLVHVLRTYVEQRRGQPLPLLERDRPLTTTPPAQWPAISGIDAVQSSRILGGDRDFFIELLRQVVYDHEDPVATIQQKFDAGQALEAANLLHKLRGRAGNLGANDLLRAASAAEQAIRQHAPDCTTYLATLAATYHTLIDAARHWLEQQPSPDHDAAVPSEVDLKALRTQLKELHGMLREHRFDALQLSEQIRHGLQASVWYKHFQPISQAVANLQLERAESLLVAFEQTLNDPLAPPPNSAAK